MNRMLFQTQKFKYVKLCIVSPLYEILVNLLYIISFFLLSFHLLANNSSISYYRINQIANEVYEKEAFMKIKAESDLFNYIKRLIDNLYRYNSGNKVNIMIPFGSVRLKKYAHQPNKCIIDYTKICNNYNCTVAELSKIYKDNSLCGFPYQKKYGVLNGKVNNLFYDSLVRDFEGKYSQYDLVNDGQNFDFTIDNFTSNPSAYKDFIRDKDMKFFAIIFNVYFPMSKSYICVLAGIEMVNYFTFPHPIFSPTAYIHFNTNNAYFLTVFVFFCISVALNSVKFIYEANVKFMLAIHLLTFANEVINILFIVFISFYMSLSNHKAFLVDYENSIGFKDNLSLIMVNSYNHIIISILFLCIPFRILSLISWSPQGSSHFARYFSVVFRILPGVLVLGFIMIMIILVFTYTNFFMYNGKLHLCENVFNSLNMVFNFQLIRDINLLGFLDHSISHSKIFLLYNVLQMIIFGITFGIGVATFVYLFRKAASIESEKEDNDVAIKLDAIREKLTSEIMQYDNNLNGMNKQILWINLGTKNDLANSSALKQRVLQFKQANQIIAFLKYLFALKPDLQFKNLDSKYDIVIECRAIKGKLKDFELEEIDMLLDWLSFVGCKIPVVLFSVDKLERNLRMKIATCYIMVRFMSQKENLFTFLNEYTNNQYEEEEKVPKVIDMDHMMSQQNRFIIYPNIIRKNDSSFFRNNTNLEEKISFANTKRKVGSLKLTQAFKNNRKDSNI